MIDPSQIFCRQVRIRHKTFGHHPHSSQNPFPGTIDARWRDSAMAPKKRKSGEGAGGPKAKAKKGGDLPLPPPDSI